MDEILGDGCKYKLKQIEKVYNNSRGVFLIPHHACMSVTGISGILIESITGQFSAMGTAHAFYR